MNLPQINIYATEFHKQLKKTHPHLGSDQIFGVMSFQYTSLLAMAPEYKLDKKIQFALRTMAELTYVSLLSDEEFIAYQKETEELHDTYRQSGRTEATEENVQEITLGEQISNADSVSAQDQHSDEARTPAPRYPY